MGIEEFHAAVQRSIEVGGIIPMEFVARARLDLSSQSRFKRDGSTGRCVVAYLCTFSNGRSSRHQLSNDDEEAKEAVVVSAPRQVQQPGVNQRGAATVARRCGGKGREAAAVEFVGEEAPQGASGSRHCFTAFWRSGV